MEVSVERYIIQLEDGYFGAFEQVSSNDIEVLGLYNFSDATMFSKDRADRVFEEMNGNGIWSYHGNCVKPKKIRKVKLALE